MSIGFKFKRDGVSAICRKVSARALQKVGWYKFKFRNAKEFADPTPSELIQIESELNEQGVRVVDLIADRERFQRFVARKHFSDNYHGGPKGKTWLEKHLEHWLSWELLRLDEYKKGDIYVDVAAASSPWAFVLRDRFGIEAFANDLEQIGESYESLPYYKVENAIATSFKSASVKGVSLHCAYEMFLHDDDINLIRELARVLKPGGKAVILPLYTHTHYCSYSAPQYFGKGHSDSRAVEYIRHNSSWVPSSRKYDPATLKSRILDAIVAAGMTYQLSVLRNAREISDDIYCHFILEIIR